MTVLRECTSIERSGNFVRAQIVEKAGRLLLSDGVSEPRPLGEYGALAEEALSCLPNCDFGEGSYFERHPEFRKGIAAEIVELLDECEWDCPTCIAASFPGKGNIRGFDDVTQEISAAAAEGPGSIIMLSGGEPTIHPRFLDLIKESARYGSTRSFLITNGRAISESVNFCEAIKARNPNIHVYLQYDSFKPEHLRFIRGKDYSELRQRAIENLETAGLRYTLVCVVMAGVNDSISGEIVQRNLWRKNIMGITFQPIKFIGRNQSAEKDKHSITTLDLAKTIESQLRSNMPIKLGPHPCNPINWSICNLSNSGEMIAPSEPTNGFKLYEPDVGNLKRIAIVWHTDYDNFVAESVCSYPIVARENGNCVPLFVKYNVADKSSSASHRISPL